MHLFKRAYFDAKFNYQNLFLCISLEKQFLFTNYRPISLLPQFSNILEKLNNKKLNSFLNKCNILSPRQYGLRSSISKTEALLELVEDTTTSLDNNTYAVGMFIYLTKAFDNVNHNILCNKNDFCGVRGVAQK